MDFLSAHACVFLSKTRKFSVLEVRQEPKVSPSKDATTPKFPCLSLSDVLTQSSDTSEELKLCLSHHGYVILTYPDNSPYSKIIDSLSNTITDDFLPPSKSHESRAGGEIYVSERDVPMWKLGYERCDDVREAYRVHCGDPDRQPWPSGLARKSLLRGLCLCRHVCDAALEMTLVDAGWAKERFRGGGKSSYGSKTGYWNKEEGDLPPREGDVSVFYSMLYYNDEDAVKFQKKEDIFGLTDGMRLNVKEHVDPSLFVLEPFPSTVAGLQVFDEKFKNWLTCDGTNSVIENAIGADERAMILFVGKAFAVNFNSERHKAGNPNVKPTLHRVTTNSTTRHAVIYEQKYQEFF